MYSYVSTNTLKSNGTHQPDIIRMKNYMFAYSKLISFDSKPILFAITKQVTVYSQWKDDGNEEAYSRTY